jgi:hypothetical protein
MALRGVAVSVRLDGIRPIVSGPMAYQFRVRFTLGRTVRINSEAGELLLSNPAEQGQAVVLRPAIEASHSTMPSSLF